MYQRHISCPPALARAVLGAVRSLGPAFPPRFILGVSIVIVTIRGILPTACPDGVAEVRILFVVLIHGRFNRQEFRANVITLGAFCLFHGKRHILDLSPFSGIARIAIAKVGDRSMIRGSQEADRQFDAQAIAEIVEVLKPLADAAGGAA